MPARHAVFVRVIDAGTVRQRDVAWRHHVADLDNYIGARAFCRELKRVAGLAADTFRVLRADPEGAIDAFPVPVRIKSLLGATTTTGISASISANGPCFNSPAAYASA